MILRSVELESFGRFRGQTVEFRRGMNLVIGPNEAGKSTLAEAVPAVLFGTDRLERFKPWGRNVCSAALFFEGRGRTVQIKRNLITDDVELLEKDDLYHILSQFSGKVPLRGRSASCREYQALLESLLGVADERLFRATYFFGHHPQEWSGEELAQKLRTLVSGSAETDYAEILDGLLDEHFQLTRDNPWGRDKKRDREYEDVCRQVAKEGGAEAVPLFVEIDNSADLKTEIEKLSSELGNDRQEHEKGRLYIESVRRQMVELSKKDPSEEKKPSEKESSTVIGKPSKDQKISQPNDKKSPPNDVALSEQLVAAGLPQNPPRELPELLAEAAQIRQELATFQQPFSALNTREKKIPKVPWIVLLSLCLLLVAGTAAAWWQSFYFQWISIGSGVCCALLLGWGVWQHIAREKALADCLNERNRLDQKKLEVQKRQAFLSERCAAFGLPSSAIDLVKLQKLVTANHDLLESWWRQGVPSAADLEVCQNKSVSDGASAHINTSGGGEEPEEENSSICADDDERELRQLESRMAEFEEELKRKESRLQELQLQLKGLPAGQSPGIETPGTALQYRKRELEGRIVVLRKAINLLAGAVDEFGRLHLAGLNKAVSKLLGKITGGRYSAMRLDENMAPSLQVDGRRWVPAEHFSKGTVDAIYLALRIALAKVRDDGRSLPLMLDDPFVHLDQKRLTTALNMVDLASADGQLILFSHNLDLGKRAARERWHVVPLDGGTADTTQEEGGDHAGQLHLL
jgi:DNA repair exonuclease SbcCD ATPase subunit